MKGIPDDIDLKLPKVGNIMWLKDGGTRLIEITKIENKNSILKIKYDVIWEKPKGEPNA